MRVSCGRRWHRLRRSVKSPVLVGSFCRTSGRHVWQVLRRQNLEALHQLEATLREEIRAEGIVTRKHIDVVAETLHVEARITAEGLIALDSKVEAMKRS